MLTPIIVLSTQESLEPSGTVAATEFKSIDSIINGLKPVNKFKLNVSNVLGVNEDVSVLKAKRRK